MVVKTKYPGICDNCGQKSEYHIRYGTHILRLCGTCLARLGHEVHILLQHAKEETK